MKDVGTHASSPIVFVGRDGTLKVRDYSSVHGPGVVNVTIYGLAGSHVLSLNLSAGKAKELQCALGVLLGTIPPSWADAQVTP